MYSARTDESRRSGSLIYITLQRAKTAREAIGVIVELANTYGYASSGESFSIADPGEAWIMELIGKGSKPDTAGINTRKGIVWVARRIPDGYVSAHANQSRITTFPLDDPENCLYAPDVIDFAREMGYFEGEDADFTAPLRASHSKTEIPWARKYAPQTLLAAGSAWSARLRMTTRGFPPTSSSKSGFRLAMGIRASMTSATTSTYLRFSPIIRRVLVMWPGYHWMFTFLSSPFPAGAAARPGTVLFHN